MKSGRDRFEVLLTDSVRLISGFRFGYAIIGGAGVLAWGQPIATKDVDVLVNVRSGDYFGLLAAFLDKDYVLAAGKTKDQATMALRNGWWVRLFHPNDMWIDLARVRDAVDGAVVRRAQRVKFCGVAVRVAMPEDIVAYKLSRFSDKDKAGIKSILGASPRTFRLGELEKCAQELSRIHGTKVLRKLERVRRWLALAKVGRLEV